MTGVVALIGITGPKFNWALAQFCLGGLRLGIFVGLALWVLIITIRRRSAHFQLQDVLDEPEEWRAMSRLKQFGWTVSFALYALMFICLGCPLGFVPVYIFWRLL
jgi:hypothetical protein